jgi:4-amino-4-deoxy-L-arabinose transferase-like glycosyltransferase
MQSRIATASIYTATKQDAADGLLARSLSTRWSLALIFIAGLLLRLIGVDRFPGVMADEGLWTEASKNYVLYGDPFMDRLTHALLSPLFHVLSNAVFMLRGPSIASARLISALAGAASPILFYLLIRRLNGRRDLALWGGVLFSVSEWAVFTSRIALIESLQLALILLTAVLIAFDDWRMVMLAGVAFGLVLLTKVNAIFALAPCAVLLAVRATNDTNDRRSSSSLKTAILRSLLFLAVSLGLAGSIYGLLYLAHPVEFTRAFKFELDGRHFEGLSHPLVRVGRFGLDPLFAGRTLLALFREEPFFLVLGSLGIILAPFLRPRGSLFFAAWLLMGGAYFLTQMFQPLRYFFLIFPAILFFVLVTVDAISSQTLATVRWLKPHRAVIALIVLFEIAYLAADSVANRGGQYANVLAWMHENTQPSDRVLASALLSTDLRNQSFQYYRLLPTPENLTTVTQTYHIKYVVVDTSEWPLVLRTEVAHRFRLVRQWQNAAVYEVPHS